MDIESNNPGTVYVVPRKRRWLCVITTLFHFVTFTHFAVVLAMAGYYFYKALSNENEYILFMTRLTPLFFTTWNVLFQTVFLLLALSHDILEWTDQQESPRAKKIAFWRDVIFNALVVPFTMFVTIMFWVLYAIDRELVFPEVFDTVVPWWFNHCVHTNICIILILETLLTPRRQPTDRTLELKLNSVVSFGYAVVYYSIYFITNRWLYNVFGIMTWWQICLYQILIWSSTYFFYFMHFPVNRLFHREEKTVEDHSQSDNKSISNGDLNMEVTSKKESTDPDSFTAENWNLKYRSLREKFENSRL